MNEVVRQNAELRVRVEKWKGIAENLYDAYNQWDDVKEGAINDFHKAGREAKQAKEAGEQ